MIIFLLTVFYYNYCFKGVYFLCAFYLHIALYFTTTFLTVFVAIYRYLTEPN